MAENLLALLINFRISYISLQVLLLACIWFVVHLTEKLNDAVLLLFSFTVQAGNVTWQKLHSK